MSDEDAFLAAILEQPEDRLRQLVFADWLDERGRHLEAALRRADIRAFPRTYQETVRFLSEPREYVRDVGWECDCKAVLDLADTDSLCFKFQKVYVTSENGWGLVDVMVVRTFRPKPGNPIEVDLVTSFGPYAHGGNFYRFDASLRPL